MSMSDPPYTGETRPQGSNADEWHLFLAERLDNRAAFPNALPFVAVQIAEAIDSVLASALATIEAQGEEIERLKALRENEIAEHMKDLASVSEAWDEAANARIAELEEALSLKEDNNVKD